MPEFLADPSVLTKEKLKSELIANNVSLPGGEQRKDVYVQLYLQHLTARNPPAAAQPDFSSDEEREPTPLGPRGRGAAAAGRVSAAAALHCRPGPARRSPDGRWRRGAAPRGRGGEKWGRLGLPWAVWSDLYPPGDPRWSEVRVGGVREGSPRLPSGGSLPPSRPESPRGSAGCVSVPTWKGEAAEEQRVWGVWCCFGARVPSRVSQHMLYSSAAALRSAGQLLHAFPDLVFNVTYA